MIFTQNSNWNWASLFFSLHYIVEQELSLARLTVTNHYLSMKMNNTNYQLPSTTIKDQHLKKSSTHPLVVSLPIPNLVTASKLIYKPPNRPVNNGVSWYNSWTSHEQVLNKSLTSHEQVFNKSWTSCKQVINESWTSWWTSYEQVINKSWTSHKQVMNK